MKKWLVLLLGALLLVGCGQGGTPEPTVLPAVSQAADKVVAEATIEPVRWVELRFTIEGRVVELLVEEGDEVAEGDLLVQLNPTDAELAVREAEAALASAKTDLAQVKAGPRPEEIAEAEAELSDASAVLSQAVAQRDEIPGTIAADIAAAQADLAAAEQEQLSVREEHRGIHELANNWRQKDKADYRLYAANEALASAQARLQAQQNVTDARVREAGAGVWLAAAQRDVAQAELDLLKAGTAPDDVAVSEAAVQQAEAALATAKAAPRHTEMRAPFAGTVTKVDVEVGEMATPGEVVVVLATLEPIQAVTTDLTELDVARMAEGQPVAVTADALPDRPLRGHVARIDLQSEDYRGDVVYPVTVELDETAPELRWGMTVMVEIEVD